MGEKEGGLGHTQCQFHLAKCSAFHLCVYKLSGWERGRG